jgi:hypothetical protein
MITALAGLAMVGAAALGGAHPGKALLDRAIPIRADKIRLLTFLSRTQAKNGGVALKLRPGSKPYKSVVAKMRRLATHRVSAKDAHTIIEYLYFP